MATEIERKFIVISDCYKQMADSSVEIRQAYLSTRPERTVRVRTKGNKAFITVKGITEGCSRKEWEYPVPYEDALEMMQIAEDSPIVKTRWIVPYGDFTWEVDEFHGALDGLTIAEVELPTEDVAPELPPFAGMEVTGDAAYYNSSLSKKILPGS